MLYVFRGGRRMDKSGEGTFKVDWQKQFAQQQQIPPRTTEKQSEKHSLPGVL